MLAGLEARHVLDPGACEVVAAIRELTGGRGAHASIDAAGVAGSFAAMLHGTRVDGTAVVVAIHHHPVVIPPFDLLMPEVHLTGVALSVNAFPSVIAEMARGSLSAGRLGRDDTLRRHHRAGHRAPAATAGNEDRGGRCRAGGAPDGYTAAGSARMKAADLPSVAGVGAVVTGAASGLGLAIAEALAENGACVPLLDVDSARLAAETARLAALGYPVRARRVADVKPITRPSSAASSPAASSPPTGGSMWYLPMLASTPVPGSPRAGPGRASATRTGALESYAERALAARHRY